MNYNWKYEAPEASAVGTATRLAKKLNIHPILGKLLADRGITEEDAVRRFFSPKLTYLHDPFLMNDMQKAVDRLKERCYCLTLLNSSRNKQLTRERKEKMEKLLGIV